MLILHTHSKQTGPFYIHSMLQQISKLVWCKRLTLMTACEAEERRSFCPGKQGRLWARAIGKFGVDTPACLPTPAGYCGRVPFRGIGEAGVCDLQQSRIRTDLTPHRKPQT